MINKKLNVKIFICVILFFLFVNLNISLAGWNVSKIPNSGQGYVDSMLIDNNGKPHILYRSDCYNFKSFYLNYYSLNKNNKWINKSIYGADPKLIQQLYFTQKSFLTLDKLNRLHLIVSFSTKTNIPRVYKIINGNSEQNYSHQIENISDVTLDKKNRLYLVNINGKGNINCSFFDGKTFITAEVDENVVYDQPASLCLDSNNYPHISYYTRNGNLKYAFYNGKKWIISVVEKCTTYDSFNFHSKMFLDNKDQPHIVYFNNLNANLDLQYAYISGDKWIIKNIDKDVRQYFRYKLDANNIPHVLNGKDSSGMLKYSFYNNNKWTTETISNDLYNPSYYDYFLNLDKNNIPHIFFMESKGMDENHSLKHIIFKDNKKIEETIDNNYSQKLVNVTIDQIGQFHLLNLGESGLSYSCYSAIDNKHPNIKVTADKYEGRPPLTVNFKAKATDPDGNIESYKWWIYLSESKFSALSPTTLPPTPNTTFKFENPGEYTIRCQVTDNNGAEVFDTVNINVIFQ